MKINHEKDVREFHEKFGPFTIEQQQSLVEEKCKELAIAILQGDRVAIARECVDLIYACVGWVISADCHGSDPRCISNVMGLLVEAEHGCYTEYPSNAIFDMLSGLSSCRQLNQYGELAVTALRITRAHDIPLAEVWSKVHAANMRKVRNPPWETCDCRDEPHAGPCLQNCAEVMSSIPNKPTKPTGWVGPDVAGVLGMRNDRPDLTCEDVGCECSSPEPEPAQQPKTVCECLEHHLDIGMPCICDTLRSES